MFFFNQRACVVILSASTKLQPPGSQQVPVLPSCHSRPHRMTGGSLRPRFVSLVVSSAKLTNTLSFLLLSHCSIPCAPCASRSRGVKPQTNQNQPNRKNQPNTTILCSGKQQAGKQQPSIPSVLSILK